MPETPATDQEQKRKTEEQIRCERIAAVTEPQVRSELDTLVRDRDARLAEITEKQAAEFERRVAAKMASRATAARDPNYRGFALPATREAAAQAVQLENRAELERQAKSYNERIDEKLKIERDKSREAQPLSQQSPDALRTALQPEEERRPQLVKREQGQEEHPIEPVERRSDKTEDAVDWRRILKDPDYRREVQAQEFRRGATELTESGRAARRTEAAGQPQAPQLVQTHDASQSASIERETPKKAEQEEVDWRRILKDPEYRREVQAREFGGATRELTQGEGRTPSISPE
jgi:hypothetical protein